MKTEEIIKMTSEYVMNTYSRIPIAPVSGRGAKLIDADGREYLDFVAGLAVNSTGHCHPKVVEAVCKQAQALVHTSNLYHIEPQARLAKLLVEQSGLSKAFFCNSGAEANEAAIKLARRYSHEILGREAFEIVTAARSFHGRTLATVTATGQEKYHKGFYPLPTGFKYVVYNDIESLKAQITESTCAVMLEPIQGEGGIYPADPEYLRAVRALCNEHRLLLIFDEVQTGVGRSGKFFAYQLFEGVKPDIVTLAKGLASGVPIGAMIASAEVAKGFEPGTHASTFGGNFLACATALATLSVILEDGVLENVRRVGSYLKERLSELKAKTGLITAVRGHGLMIGVELVPGKSAPAVVAECRSRGLLLNAIGTSVLRFVPPLVVTEKDIDSALDILEAALTA